MFMAISFNNKEECKMKSKSSELKYIYIPLLIENH